MIIYFIRHGETLLNKARKVQGCSDAPLIEEAREQTYAMAKKMTLMNIRYVMTSDLGRAVSTGDIIAKTLEIPVENIYVSDKLREYNYGIFDGQSEEDMEQSIKQYLIRHKKMKLLSMVVFKNSFKKGKIILDTIAEINNRSDLNQFPIMNATEFFNYALEAFQSIVEFTDLHREGHVVVVSHGHLLMTMLSQLSQEVFKERHKLNNLEGFLVEIDDASCHVEDVLTRIKRVEFI